MVFKDIVDGKAEGWWEDKPQAFSYVAETKHIYNNKLFLAYSVLHPHHLLLPLSHNHQNDLYHSKIHWTCKYAHLMLSNVCSCFVYSFIYIYRSIIYLHVLLMHLFICLSWKYLHFKKYSCLFHKKIISIYQIDKKCFLQKFSMSDKFKKSHLHNGNWRLN